MIGWLYLAQVSGSPVDFPSHAIPAGVSDGRLVCRRGAGIERTMMGDHVTLGTWFDGRIMRRVDSATWVSPAMVSRWLGFLAEKEGWEGAELDRHWQSCRTSLGGRLTVVLRLAAFPRLDPFELNIGAPPKPDSLLSPTVTISYVTPGATRRDDRRTSMTLQPVASALFEKEEPAPVTNRPFYSLTSLAPLFLSNGQTDEPDDGVPLGDYYGAVYVVQVPVAPEMRRTKALSIQLKLHGKSEHANFFLTQPPKDQSPADASGLDLW